MTDEKRLNLQLRASVLYVKLDKMLARANKILDKLDVDHRWYIAIKTVRLEERSDVTPKG